MLSLDDGIVFSAVYSPDGQKFVCATERGTQLLDAHAGAAVIKFSCVYADFTTLITLLLIEKVECVYDNLFHRRTSQS